MKEGKSRQQIIKEATKSLLVMFESGKMPEAIALTYIRRKAGDELPSLRWSLGNQILMYSQGTTDARGFNQWQKVGRYVKEGSKAVYILAPITWKHADADGQEQLYVKGFKQIPLFRYEDTDGKELVRPDYKPPTFPPLWNVAAKLGVNVKYAPLTENYYGKFSPSRKEIVLCSHDEVTLYHELSHVAHDSIKPLTGGQNPEQEIVAEMAACVLCEIQGIRGYEYQGYKYMQEYCKALKTESVLGAIMRVLSDVQAVVDKILELAEEPAAQSA